MANQENKYRGTREYYLAYSELVQAARYRGVTTYPAIATLTGLPSKGSQMAREVCQLLGEISEEEARNGRPMLSAVVVSSVDFKPGHGFYVLARILGKLGKSEDEYHFWQSELASVYDTWKRNSR